MSALAGGRVRKSVAGILGALSLLASPGMAAPPVLEAIFPAGGQRGTSFTLAANGKLEADARLWCDAPGVFLVPNGKKREWQVTILPDAPTGLHLVRAFNAEGASAVRWFSVGLISEAAEAEPNDAVAEAQKLEKLPLCLNGRLEKSGDIDGFSFTVEAGRTIFAALEAYALGAPVDAVLNLFDEQGTRIATAHDGRCLDPVLMFKAAKAGRYTVQVSGFTHPPAADVRFTGGTAVVYRLQISTEPVATHVFPPVVAAGVKSKAELRGANLEGKDATVEVDGTRFVVGETLQTLDLPRWVLGPLPVIAAATTPVIEHEPNNTAAEAHWVGLPCSAAGTIAGADDVDRFAFQLKKGERAIARVRARELGLPLDAALRIEAADGKVLASNDDQSGSADAAATFTASADGVYHAVVSDLFHQGGPAHHYVIEIGPEQPDFEVALSSAESLVLAAGKTAELTAKVKRLGGFSGPLVATALGLPAGVFAEPALVNEKNGEVKLTLAAAANAPAASQPVQLAITAKDLKPPVQRTATFQLRGENKRGTTTRDTSDQIWLTVTPGKPAAAQSISPPPQPAR